MDGGLSVPASFGNIAMTTAVITNPHHSVGTPCCFSIVLTSPVGQCLLIHTSGVAHCLRALD